jgi:hypothetical protein
LFTLFTVLTRGRTDAVRSPRVGEVLVVEHGYGVRVRLPGPLVPRHVDDALGLVRLLYAMERERVALDLARLHALLAIGKELADVADLARRCKPDSVGGRAAVTRADAAGARLVALGWPEDLRVLVELARTRVRNGRTVRLVDDRELARLAREKRG